MPTYGAELWEACTAPIPHGLEIVRSWQQGPSLLPAARQELKTLARTPAFIAQQLVAANAMAERAWTATVEWAQGSRNAAPSLREFCWMFDIITQNGGLKSVTPESTKRLINSHGVEGTGPLILDWLDARGVGKSGYNNSRKNVRVWRNGLGPPRRRRSGIARRLGRNNRAEPILDIAPDEPKGSGARRFRSV